MIQTDRLDKKALDVSTTLIAPLEQEAKDGQTKLDTVPKEEEEQAERQLRTWIEEENIDFIWVN